LNVLIFDILQIRLFALIFKLFKNFHFYQNILLEKESEQVYLFIY